MDFFAIGEFPDSWYEPMLLPVFMAAAAAIIWIGARSTELKTSTKRPWKWAAILPLLLAFKAGVTAVMNVGDPFYRSAIAGYGKKMVFSHYAAFVIPLLVLIGVFVWQALDARRSTEYDR